MDPDTLLEGLLSNCGHFLDGEGGIGTATDVMGAVSSLDEWLMKGGFMPQAWAEKCNGGLLKRAALAVRVYDEALEGAGTFEGELGMQLAYLVGAILKGDKITLHMEDPEENEVHQFFELLYSKDHPVWVHIGVENQ